VTGSPKLIPPTASFWTATPRTVTQMQFLDHVLADKGQQLDTVLQLTVDREELITRLLAVTVFGILVIGGNY
jgi:adenylate kinase family enzyme